MDTSRKQLNIEFDTNLDKQPISIKSVKNSNTYLF